MKEIRMISVNDARTETIIGVGNIRITFAKINGKVKEIGRENDSQVYDPANFRLPKSIFNRVFRQAHAILG